MKLIILHLSLILQDSIIFASVRANNACKHFTDYINYNTNKNCFYNSDMSLQVAGLIKKYIGNVETHHITTEDGYILTMFRMPRENYKGVILLQHSLAVDSRVWVGQGNDSLAFYLWHNGYEIWLSNARGTQYSLKHQTLPIRDFRYWNFSLHEIGFYDLSSQISLVKNYSHNSKIIYIGHSQGSSVGLIYSSLKPQEANNSIKLIVFMSTPCFYTHISSPLKLFTPFEPGIQSIVVDTLKLGNVLLFLPLAQISKVIFRLFPLSLSFLNLILSLFFGWTPKQIDPRILNFDCGVYLSDFSWKLLLHYLQLVKSQIRFQQFDYGKRGNLKYYNSKLPPRYPIEDILVPIFFISSQNDSLTTLQDTDILIKVLNKTGNIRGHLKVKGLNHMDFHFGRQKRKIYFEQLGKMLDKV